MNKICNDKYTLASPPAPSSALADTSSHTSPCCLQYSALAISDLFDFQHIVQVTQGSCMYRLVQSKSHFFLKLKVYDPSPFFKKTFYLQIKTPNSLDNNREIAPLGAQGI